MVETRRARLRRQQETRHAASLPLGFSAGTGAISGKNKRRHLAAEDRVSANSL